MSKHAAALSMVVALSMPLAAHAQSAVSPGCPTGISFEFEVDTPAKYVADTSRTVQPTKGDRDSRNVIQFVVDTAGVVASLSLKVLRGTDVNIVDQARASVQAWRYTPAKRDGRSVCQLVQTSVDTAAHR